MAENCDRVMTREHLLQAVWGYEYFGDMRTVDVTIRRLREKIEDDPSQPEYIITRRGLGYSMRNPKKHRDNTCHKVTSGCFHTDPVDVRPSYTCSLILIAVANYRGLFRPHGGIESFIDNFFRIMSKLGPALDYLAIEPVSLSFFQNRDEKVANRMTDEIAKFVNNLNDVKQRRSTNY